MGLIYRTSSLANAGTSSIKNAALTWEEGDGNIAYLLTNLSGSNVSISGSTTINGAVQINGTTQIDGLVYLPQLTSTAQNNLITYDSASGRLYYTASNTIESDPVFTSKSASLATTGSNLFLGNQTINGNVVITGSLTISGSNTFTNVGSTILSGSIVISGSQIFNGSSTSIGTQVVTGSLITSGSNELIGSTVLSGSIDVSGSQTFYGISEFYGNHILSGSNTIVGNTVLSGSIEVSGSSVFHNSSFIVTGSTSFSGSFTVTGTSHFEDTSMSLTGSLLVKGRSQISGSTGVTGSFEVRDGDINIVSGSSFTRWGNKLFNYGAFSDYTTQSGSANTVHAIKFNTTDLALGMSLSGSSAIKIQNTGVYNFQWSGQANQGSGASVISVWLRINGQDVSGSRGDITLASNSSALPAWNYVLLFNANDDIELYWSSNSNNTTWVYAPTGSNPTRPSTASIIATVTQMA